MWIDIVIALIFVLSTARGYRKGFIYTFIHTAGWILAMVLGYIWYPHVSAFLSDKTGLYYGIHEKIADKVSNSGSAIIDPVSDNLPAIFGNVVDSAEQAVTSALTDGLSDFLFQIISFLAVVIGIRLLFILLSSLFGKKRNKGITGFVDGFFGLIVGMLKGAILVFLLLALLVPVIGLSGGDFLADSLRDSSIASTLYDNNLVLLIIKDLL